MRRFTNFKLGGVVLTLLFLLCASGSVWGQTEYKTLSFPDDNSANNGVGSYTDTWTAKIGGDSWTIANFNNNKWGGGWSYIRCGREKAASTASITTDFAIDRPVSSVVVTVDKITASKVNSISLQVASDADFNTIVETVEAESLASGDMTFVIGSPVSNCYYKLIFDCPVAGKNGVVQISKVIYYAEGEATQVSSPVFTPASGETFVDELTVTAACSTDGATIYYTTDGADPTTSSSVFPAEGLPINATTTIKAMAADGKLENSEVVTATYTKVEPLSIADFKAATGEQFLKLENAVVTAVGTNDIFIQDAEGHGLDLYKSGQDYEVGDVLNGYVKGTSTAYANMPQLTGGDYSNVTVTKDGTVSPKVITIVELAAAPETYYCSLVKIEDVTYEAGKFAQGVDALAFYDKFNAIADDYGWPSSMDVTGIFAPYNSTLQIYPRTEADIENVSGLDVPTFAWSAASYSVDINNAAGASYPTLTNTSDGTVTYESSTPAVATIDATTGEITLVAAGSTTITASVAATDKYSAASASYTLTVIDASALPEPQAIVAERNGEYYAMLSSNEISNSKLDALQVFVWNGNVVRTAGASDFAWYIDENEGTIVNAAGEYATQSEVNETNLEVSTRKFTWSKTQEGYWASSLNNSSTRVLGLGTSGGSEVFGVYAISSTQNQFAIAMPIVDGYTRTVTSGNYGTICLPYAVSAGDYDGVEFFSVAGKVMEDGEATAIVLNEETELEAGKPYVFSATTDKLIAIYSGEAASAEVDGNGLVGSFSGTTVDEGMYLLKDNTVKLLGEAGGNIEANRAYFDLGRMSEYTEAVGVNQRLISLGGNEGGTTGVEGIAAEEDALVDVYTIGGVMVRSQVAASGATDGLAKGLYIVGGKKVVVK